MRVTTVCDCWLPRWRPRRPRCRPPPRPVVPNIFVGAPQHHTVRVVTRRLELEPPIVTDDVAKRSRRTHVVLRPKEKVDGLVRVERTRFCLGGLGPLLPVCAN